MATMQPYAEPTITQTSELNITQQPMRESVDMQEDCEARGCYLEKGHKIWSTLQIILAKSCPLKQEENVWTY